MRIDVIVMMVMSVVVVMVARVILTMVVLRRAVVVVMRRGICAREQQAHFACIQHCGNLRPRSETRRYMLEGMCPHDRRHDLLVN